MSRNEIITFGKYKGYSIAAVPNRYLWWIRDTLDENKFVSLIDAAEEELEYRLECDIVIEEE